MKLKKITKKEKDLLRREMVFKIDNDNDYQQEVFKTVFKEDVKINIAEWNKLDLKGKVKIADIIIKYFDKSFVTYAQSVHGRFKQRMILQEIARLKDEQLKEFGVRK